MQKHGRRWRWRARDADRIVVRSFASLEDATNELDRFLDGRSKSRRLSQQTSLGGISVSELCRQWLMYKTSFIAPATANQYEIHVRVHIAPGIGAFPAATVRPLDLSEFYRTLRWKPAKESHNILRQAFDWGIQNGLIARDSNPCVPVRPSRRTSTDHDGYFDSDQRARAIDEKDIPTAVEMEKLLVDAAALDQRTWWLYLKIAAATGARPGEVSALRAENIDLEGGTIRIEWSADRVSGRLKRPKTASGVRTLWLPPSFFAEISACVPCDPSEFLFPSNTQPGAVSPLPCWNSRGVKRRLDAALDRTGIRHFSPHSFRHFVATHLLAQGWPPLQVARFLGHANDSLVRTLYANHIVDETQRLIGEAAANLV